LFPFQIEDDPLRNVAQWLSVLIGTSHACRHC
jgi:hypothetical protein